MSSAPPEQSAKRKVLGFLARFLTLFSLILFAFIVLGNHWFGSDLEYAWGGVKATDLSQHYGGAQMWDAGQKEELYRGFKLGEHINEWKETLLGHPDKSKIERFNYVYSPFVVEIASWFVGLPYGWWISFWFYLTCFSYLLVFLVLKKSHPDLPWFGVFPVILFFGFHSFYYVLIPGQNTTLTLLVAVSSAWLLNEKREWQAGFLFSCAFYKPQLMPYIGLFMLLCGYWRFFLALGLGGVFWLLLGILITGWEAHLLWFESLKDMAAGLQFQKDGLNQGWRGLYLSAFSFMPRPLIDAISHLTGLLIMIGTSIWVRRCPKKLPWKDSYTLFLALTCWLLASPYVGHYEVLLGICWWMVFLLHFRWNPLYITMIGLYWLLGLVSVVGLSLGISISAPFITLWLFGSLWLSTRHRESTPEISG